MSKPKRLFPDRSMVRPIVYQVFTRYLTCLCFALLWDFFFNRQGLRPVSTAFLFFAVFFAVLCWLAYLRLDGISVPKFDRSLFRRKKTPERAYGDLIDYVDEPIVTFDDLDTEEKDLCLLWSNLATALLFVLTAILRP